VFGKTSAKVWCVFGKTEVKFGYGRLFVGAFGVFWNLWALIAAIS
jgi:hypothetical protein